MHCLNPSEASKKGIELRLGVGKESGIADICCLGFIKRRILVNPELKR